MSLMSNESMHYVQSINSGDISYPRISARFSLQQVIERPAMRILGITIKQPPITTLRYSDVSEDDLKILVAINKGETLKLKPEELEAAQIAVKKYAPGALEAALEGISAKRKEVALRRFGAA